MNKNSTETISNYHHIPNSNPSLKTAGLGSTSLMTTPLILPSSPIIKQNHHLNQNQATNTQPISLFSEKTQHNQSTNLSHRTLSDTYLNLSHKDIDELMLALKTLAEYVHNDMDDNKSSPLTMLYSNTTNYTLKNSLEPNNLSHYSIRHRRHSLSSGCCLNHHHHHHIKDYLNLVKDFQHDLYDIKRKHERRLEYLNHHYSSNYSSFSSNPILYRSTCRSKQTNHCSRNDYSTIKIPLEDLHQKSIKSTPLSSYILDKFIYINQNESFSNIQMLPQQAHTFQILQNRPVHSYMSIDSFNRNNMLRTTLTPTYSQKRNHNQTPAICDQSSRNKIDVATQWSLQTLSSKSTEINDSITDSSSKYSNDQENSTILSELTRSITTINNNNKNTMTIHLPLISKTASDMNNSSLIHDTCYIKENNDLTKSETERFLTTFNIPTCKCSITKLETIKTNVKESFTDDNITCISLDDTSSIDSSNNKKKTKSTSIKFPSKRPYYHHTSKSLKNNRRIKRKRHDYHHAPSNNRLNEVIQSLKDIDPPDDSSLDFFDINTIFSDTNDQLFSCTTRSENSSSSASFEDIN